MLETYNFLEELELVICKVKSKGKPLMLCGDWNICILQDSAKHQKLQNSFFLYKLINTVKSQTRIRNTTSSLIDVMVINNLNYENIREVLDVGHSDHLAQILHIKLDNARTVLANVRKRQVAEKIIEELEYM
jgi:cellobiose phosphorylase